MATKKVNRGIFPTKTILFIFIFLASIALPARAAEAGGQIRYVDAAVATSGNGLGWDTAWKTLAEATSANLLPGAQVYIKPGVYREQISLSKSGQEIVPVKSGVTLGSGNKVTFPAGTDLSSIDLAGHPGEYYAYIFRSWYSNNGVYKITGVDVANRAVTVENAIFIAETGRAGNLNYLSASIGRPIVFSKFSSDPQNERVVLDVSQNPNSGTVFYLENVVYTIFDGLDLTGSQLYGGAHIKNASFNVFQNGRIYDHQAGGILVEGSAARPAQYNLLINNKIWNTPYEGIYIGAGGQGADRNHTHFNHIIGNDIQTIGSATNAKLENAIDLKEGNSGNVIEGNFIHDFSLVSEANGALDIRTGADFTLVYQNTFKDIVRPAGGVAYVVNFYPGLKNVAFFNNLIYRTSAVSDGAFAISAEGNQSQNVLIAHNTIHNLDAGILLQYYTINGTGADNGLTFSNNIFSGIAGTLLEEWNWNNAQSGTFHLQNNIFPRDPGSADYPVPAALIGEPQFVSATDFHLTVSSPAIDAGILTTPRIFRDFDLTPQDILPDIGAFTYPTPLHQAITKTILSNGQVDGWILESSETSNQGGGLNATSTSLQLGDDAQNRQYRAILSFYTKLPANAVIVSAALKIHKQGLVGVTPFQTHGALKVDVRKGILGNSSKLQPTDFQATVNKTLAGAFGASTNRWHIARFAPAEFSTLNTAGITQFRLRFAKDDNNDRGADYLKFDSGNAALDLRPRIILQYYIP